MLRDKGSFSQVEITTKLFVYQSHFLCSFSGFYITYYAFFGGEGGGGAVITSHVHFDFAHPVFSHENRRKKLVRVNTQFTQIKIF